MKVRVSQDFACYSKECAPPPVGKGGSGTGGSDINDLVAQVATTGNSDYANSKLSKSRAPGADPKIEWIDVKNGAAADEFPMIGAVTTPGGRMYGVAWDEFDVGPQTAKIMINQYSALLDAYPEVPNVPLAIGRTAIHNVVMKNYGTDPYYREQFDVITEKAAAFVNRDADTYEPLFIAVTARADRPMFDASPHSWGVETRKLDYDQQRQYIMTHEFGHVLDFSKRSRMTPNQRKAVDRDIAYGLVDAKRAGPALTDIGFYGKSQPSEFTAESFAVMTHGLTTSRLNRDFMYPAIKHMIDDRDYPQLEWQS